MGELRDNQIHSSKPHQIYLVLEQHERAGCVNSAKAFTSNSNSRPDPSPNSTATPRAARFYSAKMVTGKPVKFLGVGEKLDALEEFRPEGMASRILEWATSSDSSPSSEKFSTWRRRPSSRKKMEKGQFTLDDSMSQMGQIKKLGSIGKVMGMNPRHERPEQKPPTE